MKILVNAATLVVGGGVQVGVSFIQEAVRRKYSYVFVVSDAIYCQLSKSIIESENIIRLKVSPSRLISGLKSRFIIKEIEKKFKPDLIYSIGFPSYIKFSTTEIGRYTNPWEINPDPLPWYLYDNIIDRIIIKFGIAYRRFWAKKADFIETQTYSAKKGISEKLKKKLTDIVVIPNSINKVFNENIILEEKENRDGNVFCLAAGYKHKNLILIPYVIRALIDKYKMNVKFFLTVEKESQIWRDIVDCSQELKVSEYINNLGELKLEECYDHYKKHSILFLPTLLEVFSATYLEAMAMELPIVTSDLEFAREVCGSAALYFEPNNYYLASDQIYNLLNDSVLYDKMISCGKKQLLSFPAYEKKYDELFKFFEDIISK